MNRIWQNWIHKVQACKVSGSLFCITSSCHLTALYPDAVLGGQNYLEIGLLLHKFILHHAFLPLSIAGRHTRDISVMALDIHTRYVCSMVGWDFVKMKSMTCGAVLDVPVGKYMSSETLAAAMYAAYAYGTQFTVALPRGHLEAWLKLGSGCPWDKLLSKNPREHVLGLVHYLQVRLRWQQHGNAETLR